MLSSVTVSISVFDTDGDSSNLSSTTNVGFSLFGKASVCATEEQGSLPDCATQAGSPGVNHVKIMRLGVRVTYSSSFLSER